MNPPSISPELVEHLSALVGLDVPPGDRPLLQSVLANQAASAAALVPLELDDLEPIVTFDPRWR